MKTRIIALLVVLVLTVGVLAGCGVKAPPPPKTLSQQMQDASKKVAASNQKLVDTIPAPEMTYSNERANLAKRAATFGNDQNKVSWIYLFADNGVILGYFSVKGKVSNLSSYLVPDDQIIYSPGGTPFVMQAPDIDGSYGTNGSGIFWYDTAGIYHEWNGLYFLTDQPVKLAQQPLMVMPTK